MKDFEVRQTIVGEKMQPAWTKPDEQSGRKYGGIGRGHIER